MPQSIYISSHEGVFNINMHGMISFIHGHSFNMHDQNNHNINFCKINVMIILITLIFVKFFHFELAKIYAFKEKWILKESCNSYNDAIF